MSEEKTNGGRFAAGRSGNPKGRKPGQSEAGRLRAIIAARAPEIIDTLMIQALSGDVAASRVLLERALAPLKAMEAAQPIKLPGTSLADDGRAVLAAVAAGDLSPAQGAALIGAVGNLVRVVDPVELEKMVGIVAALEARIEAMEAR